MAPTTEIVLLRVVPDADDAVIGQLGKILARQPGCLAVRTSRLHMHLHEGSDEDNTSNINTDSAKRVQYFIDWDSVDSHMAFARNAPVYRPFRDLFGSVTAAYDPPYHVVLGQGPDATVVFDGVAVVGRAWFCGSAGGDGSEGKGAKQGEEGEVNEALERLVGVLEGGKEVEGPNGRVVKGWSLEDGIAYKGEGCRVFFFAVACESVEACAKFRDDVGFKEAVAMFNGIEGLRGLEVYVVSNETSA